MNFGLFCIDPHIYREIYVVHLFHDQFESSHSNIGPWIFFGIHSPMSSLGNEEKKVIMMFAHCSQAPRTIL